MATTASGRLRVASPAPLAAGAGTRYGFLDFIRAIACVPVLVSHLNPTLLPGGGMGVGLFFALSGFLIARISAREVVDARSAGRFLVRRIFRVFPLMLADLALLAIAYSFFYTPQKADFYAALPGLLTMQSMPASFIGIGVGVLWTLQIEFAFYVLTPIVILLLGATRGLWVMAVTLIACSTGLVGWVLSPVWPSAAGQIDSVPLLKWGGALGIGVVLFLLWQFPRISTRLANRRKTSAYAVFAIGVLGIMGLLPFASNPDAAWHAQVLLASLFGATLILSWLMLPTIFTLPGAAFVGRVSFSIYLIHAVLADFAHYVHQTWGFPWLSLNPLIFAPIVIALAYVSYKLIEQPGIALGKRITNSF